MNKKPEPPYEHSHAVFLTSLRRAKRKGAAALSNDELLRFCRGASSYLTKYCWKNARPFFVELWRRVERHEIRGIRTKEDACRKLGCSPRWVQMIIARTAENSNRREANKNRKTYELNSHAPELTDADYADSVVRYADSKLAVMKGQDWPRFQEICGMLEESFGAAAKRLEES